MRTRLMMMMALALPACAGASEAAPAAGALPGPVSYEVRSWGRLLLHWRVDPDGGGEIWRREPDRQRGELRKYRLRLDGQALRAFAVNVEDARKATQKGIACDKDIYDLPYGSMTWDYPGARQVHSFDAGCRSDAGDEAMEVLGAASTIVETMAKVEAKPYMTEPVPTR